jgi:hypothetical protein
MDQQRAQNINQAAEQVTEATQQTFRIDLQDRGYAEFRRISALGSSVNKIYAAWPFHTPRVPDIVSTLGDTPRRRFVSRSSIGKEHGEVLLTRDVKKKKRAECKEAANKKRAGCDHYDHPIWMMVLWGKYQARCLGCETAGPIVDGGPWAAQEALYAAVRVRPD